MRVVCIGTDPAGLYLAIRIKRSSPHHAVEIWDAGAARHTTAPPIILTNPVRPDLTLADKEIQFEIESRSIDVSGVRIRRGMEESETFDLPYKIIESGVLSDVLVRAARASGCAIGAASDETPPADLVLAADGPMSRTRERSGAQFVATLEESTNRYAVFETDRSSPVMVHSFQATEHGVFRAIFFTGAEGRSKVVVDAPASVLSAAGLTEAGVHAAEPLSRLFEAELQGRRLTSLSDRWERFVTVRAARWLAGNILVLGESAYTTPFCVGLATRMSLEDADRFAQAVAAPNRDQALADASSTGLTKADSLLRAARASLNWTEHAQRYIDLPFSRLAFSYLTRSLRINHTQLKTQAPDLVRRLDRLIAGDVQSTKEAPPPPMMTPFRLRGLAFPNRIVVSPMCMYSANDGIVNDFHLVHLGSRAVGGAALIVTEMTDVSPEGRISLRCAGMYSPAHVSAWRRVTDFVHTYSDARIAIQLGHAGRKGAVTPSWEGHRDLGSAGWELLAPSAISFSEDRPVPREMTRADMDRIRDAYAQATHMSQEAGFDMIELHMAHGYLLSSFISPLSNRRRDEYGGDLENRCRFPLEIFKAVRDVWPSEKPICVRISAVDWIGGGTTIDDAITIARWLHEAGSDILAVSTGGITSERRPSVGRIYQTTYSDQIRNELNIPTMAVGGIASFGDVNTIIAAGRADMCALARGHLNDPYFVRHAAQAQRYYGCKWPSQYRGADQMPIRDC